MTPEQLNKLPRWAQEHIADLQRERDVAVRDLNKWVDSQTPSKIYHDDLTCIGESKGPTFKRRYFQGRNLTVEHAGVKLTIYLPPDNDGQRDFGVELTWEAIGRERTVALVPKGYHQVQLLSRENMR